jgi:hypothetical protein
MTPLTGSPVSLQVSGIVAQALEHCGGQPVPLRFLPDLARLTEAIDDEAALTGKGRAQVRASLVSQLVTQVEATRLLAACPGISPGRVPAPIFITDLHRTGTTLLQNLLAEHPAVRAPRLWELLAPAGPAATPDERAALIGAARRYVEEYYRASAAFRTIHPLDAMRPEECHRLIGVTFRADIYALRYHVPRYAEWLREQDMSEAYAYHRVLLSCLLTRGPAGCVVLKCPFHLGHLDALASAYPGARVVRLHRDPATCIASVCSLTTAVRSARARVVDPAGIGRYWLGYATRVLSARAPRGLAVLDIRYADLLADPIAVVARVCSFAGIPFTPAAERRMRAILVVKPGDERAVHRYSLPDYGLDPAEVHDRFAAYNVAFDL